MNALKGKKTYIVSVIGAVVTAAHLLGLIDTATWTAIMGFLGAGGLAALRAGVANR